MAVESAYVVITPPEDAGRFTIGAHVVNTCVANRGRTGTVIEWGRSRRNPDPMQAQADNEGPVIKYDDNGDEDWYPGRSMSCLESLPI